MNITNTIAVIFGLYIYNSMTYIVNGPFTFLPVSGVKTKG